MSYPSSVESHRSGEGKEIDRFLTWSAKFNLHRLSLVRLRNHESRLECSVSGREYLGSSALLPKLPMFTGAREIDGVGFRHPRSLIARSPKRANILKTSHARAVSYETDVRRRRFPCMGTYTFKIPLTRNPVRIDLPNDDEAWAEAVTLCGEMLRDMDGKLRADTNWEVIVEDQLNAPVASIKVVANRHLRK